MNTKRSSEIPTALSEARRQLDHWRSQQPSKRTRLPEEFWRRAVALAQQYGLNKTARALKVKYESLKKRLEQGGAEERHSAKAQTEFIELLPASIKPGAVECMLEWADGCGATVRMHMRGAGPSELSAVAGVFRSGCK